MNFEEKSAKNCEIRITAREHKLSCVNKDWLLLLYYKYI